MTAFAQSDAQPDTSAKKEVLINFSELAEFIQDGVEGVKKLSGGVELQQDSILMFCDTAFLKGNNVTAYGKVVIRQNDSLIVFADSLIYRGDTKIADLFGNVVLENGDKRLFTDYLNYELDPKIARYVTGGLITQGNTQLVSKRGTYYLNTDEFFFKDSITVVDSTFFLRADTLAFNTETQIVTFLGPTLIKQDSNLIYCEDGFYDIETKLAEFTSNAQYVKGNQKASADIIIYDGSMKEIRLEGKAKFVEGSKVATADVIRYEEDSEITFLEGNAYFRDSLQEIRTTETIKYDAENESFSTTGRSKVLDKAQILEANQLDFDDKTGLGLAEGNVFWQDTLEDISIRGETVHYDKKTDYIKAKGSRPLLTTLLDEDTLFLASDTLVSTRTSETDSTRQMQAFEDVRIYKADLQAVADSLFYSARDSLFKLFRSPILWSDTAQFRGDSIFIQMAKGRIDKIYLYNNAFIVNSSDLKYFNQIKGKNIIAYFVKNELHRVRVKGNAESLYYILDEQGAYLGLSKTVCSEMVLYFKNEQLDHINFYKQPNSDMTPMAEIGVPPELEGFSWDFNSRPKSVADLRNKALKIKRSNRRAAPIEGTEREAILKGKEKVPPKN